MRLLHYLLPFAISLFVSCVGESRVAEKTATQTLPPPRPSEYNITLFFGGDLMQHMPQVTSAEVDSGYCYKSYYRLLEPLWRECDAVILNLETTLSDRGFSGYPMFRSPWQIARDAKDAGVTHFVTANNHSIDCGGDGLLKTLGYLDSLSIPHVGTFCDSLDLELGSPIYIKKSGFNIALLNYSYGTNGIVLPKHRREIVSMIDTTQMLHDIQKAKRGFATNIIAFMHWGYEYNSRECGEQRELADWLHRNGVDIVIGSHPHVVQPMGYHITGGDTTGVTVYSLGNFVSNQRKRYQDGGIGVTLKLSRADNQVRYHMEYTPIWVDKYSDDSGWHYDVVPAFSSGSVAHKPAYQLFIKDTEKIIGGDIPCIDLD